MRWLVWGLAVLVLLPGLCACGDDVVEAAAINTNMGDKVLRWKLPRELREVSGLARPSGEQDPIVLAVADERAEIFTLNYFTGEVLSVFSLGNPARKGDYEGITIAAGWIYLITSDGVLLRTRGGADGDHAEFLQFDLGTREDCEIEALATAPAMAAASTGRTPAKLWAACKTVYQARTGASAPLRLYHWLMQEDQVTELSVVELPTDQLLADIDQSRFSPSAMAFRNGTDGPELIILAARERSYARWLWSAEPEYRSAALLPNGHRQAEGLEMGANGELLIADEGGKKRARLRIYPSGALF